MEFAQAKGWLSSNMGEELAKLDPPRKHYTHYYQTREANENMWHAPQGVHAFMRGYYHFKSADWSGNKPYRLEASAAAMAAMPCWISCSETPALRSTSAVNVTLGTRVGANNSSLFDATAAST